MYSQADCYL